jgi:hypothetical protein
VLPESLRTAIGEHLQRVKLLWEQDRREGFGEVYLPEGLARKYSKAAREWAGSGYFPRACAMRVRARSGGIMCRKRVCSGQ